MSFQYFQCLVQGKHSIKRNSLSSPHQYHSYSGCARVGDLLLSLSAP